MITLESGGMSYSKKIAYSISKIPIPQNERKQTGPYRIYILHGWLHKLSLNPGSVTAPVSTVYYSTALFTLQIRLERALTKIPPIPMQALQLPSSSCM
jgi:hypothetical protein